ncbi:MAG: yceI [Adhaeribacter sp.]|nr:yceI [Adhaeribacter sp.]
MKTMMTYNTYKKEFFRGLLILLAILGILALTMLSVQAQTPYKLGSGSQIKVSGTSNVHDWNMVATNFTADATFKIKGGQLQDLSTLLFVLPVTNLNGKEELLTTRAHKALKAKEYSKIAFKLTNATVIPGQKIIKTTGNLTIAGVTKLVNLQTSYVVNADESITCKGTQEIKMGDYGIKAPSYMMGAMKTGDKVTIDILLKLNKNILLSKK